MRKLIDVPYINQAEQWPTGCESVSAVMMLHHLGLDISVDDFIALLPKAPLETGADGKLHGPDPAKHFIGTPYDGESYGCYAPVIADTMNRVFETRGAAFRASDVSGLPMEELRTRWLDQGMPVVFWATIDLLPSRPTTHWILPDGREFVWACNEHCLLLVGYDDEHWIFNDPWANHGVIAYDRALVEERHQTMYAMAVAVDPLPPST